MQTRLNYSPPDYTVCRASALRYERPFGAVTGHEGGGTHSAPGRGGRVDPVTQARKEASCPLSVFLPPNAGADSGPRPPISGSKKGAEASSANLDGPISFTPEYRAVRDCAAARFTHRRGVRCHRGRGARLAVQRKAASQVAPRNAHSGATTMGFSNLSRLVREGARGGFLDRSVK